MVKVLIEIVYKSDAQKSDSEQLSVATRKTVRFFGVVVYKKEILHPKSFRDEVFFYPSI